MIETPIATGIAALIYSVWGYWKNNKKHPRTTKYNKGKAAFTIVMSLLIGVVMALTGYTTGDPIIDGGFAVTAGSLLKKTLQIIGAWE